MTLFLIISLWACAALLALGTLVSVSRAVNTSSKASAAVGVVAINAFIVTVMVLSALELAR